eukprot:3505396-Pleurochrysis_carterae.AAC.2
MACKVVCWKNSKERKNDAKRKGEQGVQRTIEDYVKTATRHCSPAVAEWIYITYEMFNVQKKHKSISRRWAGETAIEKEGGPARTKQRVYVMKNLCPKARKKLA